MSYSKFVFLWLYGIFLFTWMLGYLFFLHLGMVDPTYWWCVMFTCYVASWFIAAA